MRPALVLLVVLAWATPAGAHHLPVATDWKLAHSLPVARAAFPTTCQPLTIRTDPEAVAELDARGGIGGKFQPETCTVVVRPTLGAETFCSTLVHEFGHAAGNDHSPDEADVMHPGIHAWEPCMALKQPRHFVAWTRETLAGWRGHRWACRGGRAKRVCVGSPTGRARLAGRVVFTREGREFAYDVTYQPLRPRRRARPTGRGHARTPAAARASHRPSEAPARPPMP